MYFVESDTPELQSDFRFRIYTCNKVKVAQDYFLLAKNTLQVFKAYSIFTKRHLSFKLSSEAL